MAVENEEKTEPDDEMKLGFQVLGVEESPEYVEDPQNLYMRGGEGRAIRV